MARSFVAAVLVIGASTVYEIAIAIFTRGPSVQSTFVPIALTYDTMPPKSRLRREVNDDGSVTMSVSAADIGQLARSAAVQSTAWSSAASALVIVAILAALAVPVIWLSQLARLSTGLLGLLLVSSGVFYIALFLLIWRVRFGIAIQLLEQAAQQLCVVNVSARRVDIETAGPFNERTATVREQCEWTIGRLEQLPLIALHIKIGEKDLLAIFPGLTRRELVWVGKEIDRVMQT